MDIYQILLALSLSLIIALLAVPPIVNVANIKKLYDNPNARKLHQNVTPALGGIAIFIGFIISSIISSGKHDFNSVKYLFVSLLLVFFIGLKDDLLVISPWKKFLVQLVAASLLVFLGNIKITSLQGLFGINAIPLFPGTILSVFVILSFMNAFNLIDGIDGLASGIGILTSLILGLWFHLSGHIILSVMAFALLGSLLGFFYFNVFGKKYKLFMGDSGSLILGLIISVLVIRFNELNIYSQNKYSIDSAPAISLAIVIFPLVDMLRVMVIRLSQKKSPFLPDQNHLHHRLFQLFPHHLTVTLTILLANIAIVGFSFFLSNHSVNLSAQFLFILFSGLFFAWLPSLNFFPKRKVLVKKYERIQ